MRNDKASTRLAAELPLPSAWRVVRVADGRGSRSEPADGWYVLRLERLRNVTSEKAELGASDDWGNSTSIEVDDRSVVFEKWINGLVGRWDVASDDGSEPRVSMSSDQKMAVLRILSGNVSWALSDGELRLNRARAGSVVLVTDGSPE